jgi:hypothetical protein
LNINASAPTSSLTLDASGRLGIGITSPTARLDLGNTGNATFFTANNGSDTNINFTFSTNTTTITNNAGSGVIAFATGGAGTERARITSGGNLLVGTTSAVSGANIVAANAGGEQAIAVTNGTNVSYFGYANSNGNYIVGSLAGDATVRGSNGVSVAGNNGSAGVRLASGGTSWGSISDERLKDIIEPITNASEKVSGIRAVIGKYKVDDEGVRRSFLIAQDVQAVLPEAIDVNDDEQKTLSLKYTDVIPLLVAAIQELKADLDATKAELAALKGQQ